MTTNDLGQELLFKHTVPAGARVELAKFHSLSVFDTEGALALYMGLDAQDDLLALGKALVNAMEPEALVENQKDAEPEPYEPQVGDWVKVSETSHYNDHFRGKTLQVVDADWNGDGEYLALHSPTIGRGAVRKDATTPASAPTPAQDYDIPALVAAVADLEDRVADLEAAADTEIRVGDTVRVEPYDWNIPAPSSTRGLAVTGTVTSIVNPGQGNRYLVEYRSLVTGNLVRIYAVKATKVVSRG